MKKSLNVPELMDDAVPSTIAQKMVNLVPINIINIFTYSTEKFHRDPRGITILFK